MKNTSIEWTDHSLNFWWGCTKVSPACTHCYAESVAKVFGKRLFGTVPTWGAGKPRYERLEAARKEAQALNKAVYKANRRRSQGPMYDQSPTPPRPRVFINSMSDWLDAEVPLGWLAFLLETITLCPNLDFQLLTKRPENWDVRLLDLRDTLQRATNIPGIIANTWLAGTPPPNVWIGTTVENQEWADKRIPHLLEIPARVRFLSCEPLLGPVKLFDEPLRNVEGKVVLSPCTGLGVIAEHLGGNAHSFNIGIHWVIAGGESGGKARPTHPDWLRSLRDECHLTGVPFLFKQWGEWISVDNIRHCTSEKARLDKGYRGHKFPDGTLMLRIGDKHTGNNLDGQQHLNFPA